MPPTYNPVSNGALTIAVTGTAKSLVGTGTPARRVDIQANRGNSAGGIWIGGLGVKADGSAGGINLKPGEVYNIELIVDLLLIYANGTSGDGITFVYWQGDRV